jgi:hypothetical protein
MISKKFLFNPHGARKDILNADISQELKVFILDTREELCDKLGISSTDIVITHFCAHMDASFEELAKQNRKGEYVLKRQILGWAIRNLSPLSFAQTGFKMGRDHATIMYSSKKVFNLLSEETWGDEDVKQLIINAINSIRDEVAMKEFKLVTKQEYLKALDIVHRYQIQNNLTK